MHSRTSLHCACALGLWLSGCGADPKSGAASSSPNPASPLASASTSTATTPTSGQVTLGEDSENIALPLGDGTGPNTPPAQECQRDVYEAKRAELNLLLLVDLSGSMLNKIDTESFDTQWESVRGAMRTFVESPQADGLGISLTYYPVLEERTACMETAMCDDGAPCITAVCAIPLLLDSPQPCDSPDDCPLRVQLEDGSILEDECVLPYSCANYPLQFCLIDENCPNGDTCDVDAGPLGACPGPNSCAVTDYAAPAVPLQVLPAGRQALLDSLDDSYVDPFAATPTHIALEGAFDQVRTWRENNPDRRSVVVLATDGVPEGCETLLEPDAASATLNVLRTATEDAFNTFVIGVLPEDNEEIEGLAEQIAQQTESLRAMATAGGTETPILVRANVNTTQAFLEALDQVRSVALPCDYELPTDTRNFDLVNVELTTAGQVDMLPKVDSSAECDGAGWYYDSDETDADDAPTRVVLCSASCDAAKQTAAERVDVVLGCPTIRQIR